MIYQHLVGGRDQVIADHVDEQIKDAKEKSARLDEQEGGENKIT